MWKRLPALLFLMLSLPALAEHGPNIPLGDFIDPPKGWIDFCNRHPSECDHGPQKPVIMKSTPLMWEILRKVNAYVNRAIISKSDQEHWGVREKWAYPTDGYGDCEDLALLKKKMLIEMGFPRQTLLLTEVRRRDKSHHAVVTVRTEEGEFILDEATDQILPWYTTPYTYLKRQTVIDENKWQEIDPDWTF